MPDREHQHDDRMIRMLGDLPGSADSRERNYQWENLENRGDPNTRSEAARYNGCSDSLADIRSSSGLFTFGSGNMEEAQNAVKSSKKCRYPLAAVWLRRFVGKLTRSVA